MVKIFPKDGKRNVLFVGKKLLEEAKTLCVNHAQLLYGIHQRRKNSSIVFTNWIFPSKIGPPLKRNLDIYRRNFHSKTAALRLFCGDNCCAGAAEWFIYIFTFSCQVLISFLSDGSNHPETRKARLMPYRPQLYILSLFLLSLPYFTIVNQTGPQHLTTPNHSRYSVLLYHHHNITLSYKTITGRYCTKRHPKLDGTEQKIELKIRLQSLYIFNGQ
jgi:hypothetical protein